MKKIIIMNLGEELVENLNRNVILEHVENVETGLNEKDDLYYQYCDHKDKLKDIKSFICWKYDVDEIESEED